MPEATAPTLEMLMALRGEVQGRRPARRGREGVSGPALSPLRGRGMEYAESRIYTPGDDARHMDWRVTARTGQPHTKLFQPERERVTWIVADTAPSLYFGTRLRFKSVQAARLGALAAWTALRDGDRIGALRASNVEAPITPKSGMRGVLPVLDALVRWYAAPPSDDAGLPQALSRLRRLLRPGSRVVVLADAGSVLAAEAGVWRSLTQIAQVHVALLTDAFELSPPRARLPLRLAAGRIEFDFGSASARRGWDANHGERLAEAAQRLHLAGVQCSKIATDAAASDWLAAVRPAQAEVA